MYIILFNIYISFIKIEELWKIIETEKNKPDSSTELLKEMRMRMQRRNINRNWL